MLVPPSRRKVTAVPDWIASQRRARGDCQTCGERPAAVEWAGNSQLICWECCERRSQAHPDTGTEQTSLPSPLSRTPVSALARALLRRAALLARGRAAQHEL